jgi:hypothetical protein
LRNEIYFSHGWNTDWTRIFLTQRCKAAKSQRDEWKLASYEVAGCRWKNNFRAARHDGIVRMFSASFQDAIICGRSFQPLRSWLISGCPSGTSLFYLLHWKITELEESI